MSEVWLPATTPHDFGPEVRQRKDPNHCLCGRFAKYVGDRYYYNGRFDCYSYTVLCSRCGEVTIECV